MAKVGKGGAGVMSSIKREALNTQRVYFRRLKFFLKNPGRLNSKKLFWAAKQLLKGRCYLIFTIFKYGKTRNYCICEDVVRIAPPLPHSYQQ